jgi:hypothetical protein
MDDRCDDCGGRFNRPGRWKCTGPHAVPDLAQQIVSVIDDELNSRRGLGWGDLDYETIDELEDKLASLVRARLADVEVALRPLASWPLDAHDSPGDSIAVRGTRGRIHVGDVIAARDALATLSEKGEQDG